MKKIILASGSPRRSDILKQLGIPFEIVTDSSFEEKNNIASPYDLVLQNSIGKAEHVANRFSEPCIIISADTVVSLHGVVMGKPKNETDAFYMLKKLSSQQHQVYTGVTVISKTENSSSVKSFVDVTTVFMNELTDSEIDLYIKSGEPMDKAGAYAIQGMGALFVERICGDYYTVVGLPITKLYKTLKEFGVSANDFF